MGDDGRQLGLFTRAGIIVWRGALAAALASMALPASAQEDEETEKVRDYLEIQHALTQDFVTPHTEWAKPYAGGKVRCVYFTTWFQGSTDAREIVELTERFDLDAGAVYYLQGARLVGDGRADWYGGDAKAGTKRALRLLDTNGDLIFMNHLALEPLPQEVRDKIRDRVRDGAGLVMVGELKTLPFDDMQAAKPNPTALAGGQCFTIGRGRVALLPNREKFTYQLGWETKFDYQMAEQGRALLWAANREPKMGLNFHVDVSNVNRAAAPVDAAKLSWSGAESGTTLRLAIRRWDGERFELTGIDASGDGSTRVSIPKLREGDYYVDAIAVSGRGIENWASVPIHVSADRHVETIALDKNWAEIGEKFSGQVHFSGSVRGTDHAQARLIDARGRLLERQELRIVDGKAPFAFTVTDWMPMLLRVEAALTEGKDEISSAYEYCRVTQRHRDQFNFVMWNVPGGDLAPYGVQSLARNGVTAVLQGGEPPLALAESNLSFVPYAASFRASSHTVTAMLDPATGLLKSGCVYDQEKMQQTVQAAVKGVSATREHGTLVYSLGDENAVRASCLGPQCLEAYRGYLKETYSDIAALNREWNTDYLSFNDIVLLSEGPLPAPDAPKWFKEWFAEQDKLQRTDSEGAKGADLDKQVAFGQVNDELRALQAGNFARWYDRQAFQSYTYVQWCKQFQKAFKQLDPQARTGFEGTDSFTLRRFTTRSRQGGDLDLFVRDLDYFGPYAGPANKVVRSIAPQGFPMGNWIGYDPSAETLLREYWGQITDSMNTVQWWRYDNLDGYNGYITPCMDPFPAVRELLEDTQVVRDGLGSLLMRCRMYDDGVAMLYSMPSTHIAFFDGNETYGDYKRDHDRWHRLIQNAGLQFRYVTDRMLRLGEFDASKYKVLILPLAFAIGPKEAEVIRRFVQNGGTLIADVRPGLYDGHCKPLENGALDDVFGVKRSGKRDALEVDRLDVDGELNGYKTRLKWGNWHGKDIYPRMKIDPTVELTTGKALGKAYHIHYWADLQTPLCVVNEFGKGQAVLLNFSVFNAPADKLIAGLLAGAGVEPACRVTDAKGAQVKDLVITRWNDGKIDLMSLLGEYDGAVTVRLPELRFVYDLKARKNVGQTTEFSVTLRPNRAAFFALTARAVEPPELKVASSANPGSVVKASLRIPHADGQHAVIIRATTPDGKPAEWLNSTQIVGAEPVTVLLPFAHNDPLGEWMVRGTDLFGNGAASMEIRLR